MTIEAIATIPPGWYTDPADARAQRWWNGTQWTEHVSVPTPPAPVEEQPTQPMQPLQPLQPLAQTGPIQQFRSGTYSSASELAQFSSKSAGRSHIGFATVILGAISLGLALSHLELLVVTIVAAVSGIAAVVCGILAVRRIRGGSAGNAIAAVAGLMVGLAGTGIIAFGLYTVLVSPTIASADQPVTTSHISKPTPVSAATAAHARSVLINDVKRLTRSMTAARGRSTLWPSILKVDPREGSVLSATGRKLGAIPAGAVVAYSTSADGTGYTLTVSDPSTNVGVRYSSATLEYTSF